MNTLQIPITIDLPPAGEPASTSQPGTGQPVPINDSFQPGPSPEQSDASTEDDWDHSLASAIENAVAIAAGLQGFTAGSIGVMVTDDDTIHQINRRHLDHDYPTDVISFTYQRSSSRVEGELVISLCTARRTAQELGWDWRHELLLYVVHGTLHICGLEDSTATQRAEMRARELEALDRLGIADARRYSPAADDASGLPVDGCPTDAATSREPS